MAVAILQLGNVELRTTDPLTVRTLWRLMGTAVPAEELARVEGVALPEADRRREPA